MSTEPTQTVPPVSPRPGVLKALGIGNIVFAVLGVLCVAYSSFMWAIVTTTPQGPPLRIEVRPGPATGPGVPMASTLNPFVGMGSPAFVRFSIVEAATSLITHGLMFATGIGLLNCRRWGAWGSVRLAWAKIILVVLLWGYYIVGVAPSFSRAMAEELCQQFAAQNLPPGRMPSVANLTRAYSIVNLAVAIAVMIFTSIYPAISLWLLGRPGVRAAIVEDRTALEVERP